jgi:hypothetical protein
MPHASSVTRHISRDSLALASLLFVTLAFFWPMMLTGKFIPHGGGDLVSFLWPQYSFAAQTIRAGSIPVWNPHLYSGAPLLADNQSGVLYPINLIAFGLFPNFTYQVMEGLVVLHIWLAGVAMYFALRLWPLTSQKAGGAGRPTHSPVESGAWAARAAPGPSPDDEQDIVRRGEIARLPAVLGATAYMLNDVMVTHIGNLNLVAAAAWMPLVFGLFARGLHDRKTGMSVAAGAILAIAVLAGHAQMTAITLIGLTAVVAWQLIVASHGRDRFNVIGLAAVALLVAFGLTAAQLLPSLEMTGYSLRSGLSYEAATAYSLPPAALASFFSPLLFGRGAAEFWASWQRVETGYLGVVPLIVMGLAFTRKRSNGVWFFAGLGLLGLLIALGKYTPVYSIVHSLPILSGLRVPARFILLTDFSVAALAALGMQRLIDNQVSRPRLLMWCSSVAVVGITALTAAYLSVSNANHTSNLVSALLTFMVFVIVASLALWWIVRSPITNYRSLIILIPLAALELIVLGSTVEIDANDPTLGYQHPALVEFLRRDQNVYRIENTSSAWQPDAALTHGLDDIGGIFNPLGLANYETYRGGMGSRGSPLYNFLGVKYVLANKNEPPGDASFVPVFNADPQIDVYLNTNALPRAMLIERARVVQSGEEAWPAIHEPEFKPGGEVIVEGGSALEPQARVDGLRDLAFTHYSNERVEFSVLTPVTAYVVLSDVFYPGWAATIDDRPTPIYPADFAFRAVLVPAGSHRIVFRFESMTWRWGGLTSGVTMAAVVVWVVWRRRRQ